LRQTGVNILANDIMIFETFCVCGRTVVSVDLPSSVIGQVIGQLYVFLVEFCDALNLIKLFISPPRWSHAIGAICLSVCLSLSFFLSLCLSVCPFCLSVIRITQERVYGRRLNMVGIVRGMTLLKRLNFGVDLNPDVRLCSLSTSLNITRYDLIRYIVTR